MATCGECEHWWFKEFSINKECKLGHSTPDFDDTESCSDFETKFWDRVFSGNGSNGYDQSDESGKDSSGPNESESTSASSYAEDSCGGDDTDSDTSDYNGTYPVSYSSSNFQSCIPLAPAKTMSKSSSGSTDSAKQTHRADHRIAATRCDHRKDHRS